MAIGIVEKAIFVLLVKAAAQIFAPNSEALLGFFIISVANFAVALNEVCSFF